MISIIIPAFNIESYIGDCLNSILEQSYNDYEVIIINDGSSDNTQYIIERFIKEKQSLRFHLYNIKNSGVTAARRKGVDMAKGEWVVFVDGDDLLPPNALENFSNCISENVNIVISSYYKIESNTNTRIPIENSFGNQLFSHEDYIRLFLNGKVEGAPWAKMFRKEILTSYVFDIPKSIRNKEDILMNFRIACTQCGDVRFIEDFNYIYRWMRTGSALSLYKESNNIHYELMIVGEIERIFKENNIFLTHTSGFANLYYEILNCQRKGIANIKSEEDKIKVKAMIKVINHNRISKDVYWKRFLKLLYLNFLIKFVK